MQQQTKQKRTYTKNSAAALKHKATATYTAHMRSYLQQMQQQHLHVIVAINNALQLKHFTRKACNAAVQQHFMLTTNANYNYAKQQQQLTAALAALTTRKQRTKQTLKR